MIKPVEDQLKLALAAATNWPVRWMNGRWADSLLLSDGDMPLDVLGVPLPAIEAEVIGGDMIGFLGYSEEIGRRKYRREGLFRLYLSVAQGSGLELISTEADTLVMRFSRKTIFQSPLTAQRLITMDTRVDDGVASYEDGNRFCRMLSTFWTFDFVA